MGNLVQETAGLMTVEDLGFAVDQRGSAMSATSELAMNIQKNTAKGHFVISLFNDVGTLLKKIKVQPKDLVDFQKLIRLKMNIASTTPADAGSTDSQIVWEYPITVPFRVKIEVSGNYEYAARFRWVYWNVWDEGGSEDLSFGSVQFYGSGHGEVVADTTFDDQFA